MKTEDYLKAHNLTRTDLARLLGISKSAVSQWEEIPESRLADLEGGGNFPRLEVNHLLNHPPSNHPQISPSASA